MKFANFFKDDNDLNEKALVGFAAFIIMVVFALTDIVTGIMGIDFTVSEFIYSSFTYIVLGSFGINEIAKIFSQRKITKTE